MIIVTTGYGTDGRISSAGFLHGGEEKQLTYAYLPGTNLLLTLTKPNGMVPVDDRWMGRDCLNIPTIPAYIYSNPLFTLDYVGNLAMSTISYSAPLARGQLYDIEWDMTLDTPAKNRLYIVQKIIKDISVTWCYSTHDSMQSSRERYWEAWLVYKNEIRPKVPGNQVIDRWYHCHPIALSSGGAKAL